MNTQDFSFMWSPKQTTHKPVKYAKMRSNETSQIRKSHLESGVKIFPSEISLSLYSEIEDEDANFNIQSIEFT